MRLLRFAIVGLAILTVASVRADSWPWPLPGSESRHRTGIVLLGPIDYNAIKVEPLSDPLRKAWNDAFTLAQEGHPDAFGRPWPDRATGELVVSVANASGDAMARQWVKAGLQVASPKPGGQFMIDLPAPAVPVRIRSVQHSILQLQQVMDDVTNLRRDGVPGADRIYSAGQDPEHDRVIIETDRLNDQLLEAIAARFGIDLIAVRIDPRAGPLTLL